MLRWIVPLLFALPAFAAEPQPKVVKGEIAFEPPANPESIPEPFRLGKHTFLYEFNPKFDLVHSGVEVFTLTFPSPVSYTTAATTTDASWQTSLRRRIFPTGLSCARRLAEPVGYRPWRARAVF